MIVLSWGSRNSYILTIRAFPANMTHSPNVGSMLANFADVGLTLKHHWVNVSLDKNLVISSVAEIKAVNLYRRPTLDRPAHAHFAVGWIFKIQKVPSEPVCYITCCLTKFCLWACVFSFCAPHLLVKSLTSIAFSALY